MSQAFRCDICGDCVATEDEAKSARTVASDTTNINGVATTISIVIQTDKPHVCNSCWSIVMQRVKAWVDANLGD